MRGAEPATGAGLRVVLRPRRLLAAALLAVAALLVLGTIANLVIWQVEGGYEGKLAAVARRFDLGFEPSLPGFWSSLVLAAAAAGLGLIALDERRRGGRDARAWTALALLLALLAVDENIQLHELANDTVATALDTSGVLTFAWIVPGMAFAALVFFGFFRFLLRIDPATRRRFLWGGALLVAGAIGMEMAAGVIVERWGFDSVQHTVEQIFEEGLEMTGGLVFLYGVVDHLRRTVGRVELVLAGEEGA